ncbi:MAG: glycosyltransferase [Chloroflexi bacterium]|nr:glycosyltransferase [Chloroflexota bacterium]
MLQHQSRNLVWHSSFASLTGYSGSSLAFVLGLDARGIAVRPLYLYGADHDEHLMMGGVHPRIAALQRLPLHLDAPQVVYAPGDRFSKNSGQYRIGFTMLEFDRIPQEWVAQANQMDEVWTPTGWGAEVFAASGITCPIHVVPLGIDPARFSPAPSKRVYLADRTMFLSVFEWGPRKGWDVLVRAYRAAFRPADPVLLVLKIDCRAPGENPMRALAELLPAPSPPVGVIYNRSLDATRLAELYRSADCFVLPTRGEGWGMPILEAMACGVPAIATAWSGHTTFLNRHNGYPLPIRGLVAADTGGTYGRGARWAEPDGDALVDLLRHVAHNPDERAARGRRAADDARHWAWDRAVEAVCARLATIGGQ